MPFVKSLKTVLKCLSLLFPQTISMLVLTLHYPELDILNINKQNRDVGELESALGVEHFRKFLGQLNYCYSLCHKPYLSSLSCGRAKIWLMEHFISVFH